MSLIPLFYGEANVANSEFAEDPTFKFEFERATGMILKVDGPGDVLFSFDGKTVHGRIKPIDQYIALDSIDFSRIWLKAATGASDVRFWAWLNQ